MATSGWAGSRSRSCSQVAQHAGAHRQDDIVHRAVEGRLDRARLGERRGPEGEAAVLADALVEHGARRLRAQLVEQRRDPLPHGRPAAAGRRPLTVWRRARRCTPRSFGRPLGGRRQAAGQHLGLGGDPLRAPRRRGHRVVDRFRGQLHRRQGQGRARRAVDRAVVGLGVQGELASLVDPFDEVHLPQRPRAVERPGRDARHDLLELAVGARGGHGDEPLVELAVERRVLDPVRVVEPERHLDQPAAGVGRQAVQVLGVGRLLLRRAPVRHVSVAEDLHAADVAVVRRRFHVEEPGVESR